MPPSAPQAFLKKDHGFNSHRFPLLAFAPMGGREKFLRESRPGDVVFIAGTLTHPTPEKQRGCLLARVTVGHRPVSTIAVLESLGVAVQPHEFNADGEYRWPDGLPLTSVRHVVGTPTLKSVFGNNLSGNHWATFAMNVEHTLDGDTAKKLLALPTVPGSLPDVPVLSREATLGRAFKTNRRFDLSGPPPAAWSRNVGHELTWGSAYALRLVGHQDDIWKIGKAVDPVGRCDTLSSQLLEPLTGLSWRLAQAVDFESETHAFEFEQAVLRRLERHRVQPLREVFRASAKGVQSAWDDVLFAGDWALRDQPASRR